MKIIVFIVLALVACIFCKRAFKIPQEKLNAILPKLVAKYYTQFKIQFALRSPKEDNDDCGAALSKLISGSDPSALITLIMYSFKGLNDLGDYTACKKIPTNRYILLMLKISDGTPSTANFGICGPVQCHAEDYMESLKPIMMEILKEVMKLIDLPDSGFFGLSDDSVRFIDVDEYEKEMGTISPLAIALISFGIFVVVAVTVMTYLDYKLTDGKFKGTTGYTVVECCSLVRGARWIFYTQNPVDPHLEILNGIRVLSMCWVICGHTFDYYNVSPISNELDIPISIRDDYWLQTIIAGTFSIDVFFFMSGFLCALTMTAQFEKIKGTADLVKAVLISYTHRYIRLLPLYLLTILVTIAIVPYVFSEGPLAIFNEWQMNICIHKWWHNMLYIQNFTQIGEGCLIWSWYLANDMQFFLITPLLIILFHKDKKLCMYVIGAICVLSVIAQIIVVWHYDLSVSYFYEAKGELFEDYYVKPYDRINAYLLGIVLAWAYMIWKDPANQDHAINVVTRKWVDSAWIKYASMAIGIGITYVCVMLQYVFNHYSEDVKTWHNIVYIIVSRPMFVIGLLMVVYPAMLGKDKIMYAILGAPFWNCLAKLTYGAYMIHVVITFAEKSTEYHSTYYSVMRVFLSSIHIWVLSYFVSLILTIFLEGPVGQLEKIYLFPRRRSAVDSLNKGKDKGTTETKLAEPLIDSGADGKAETITKKGA